MQKTVKNGKKRPFLAKKRIGKIFRYLKNNTQKMEKQGFETTIRFSNFSFFRKKTI